MSVEFEIVAKNMGVYDHELKEICRYFWQACAEQNKAKIDEQAKEIEALRVTTKEVIHYIKRHGGGGLIYSDSILSIFKQLGILDESGNPTKLLTGE